MIDLNVLPIHLSGGKEQADIPGLTVRTAPKRCERTRAGDLLLVLMTFTGSAPFTPGEQEAWLNEICDKYYNARGSVTMGLRAAAEHLNNLVLKRNFSGARQGWQALALLNLAVLRKDVLYIVHAGPTHTLVLTPGKTEDFFDESNGNRGLGVSQSAGLRYFQTEITPSSLMLFCADPPESWRAGVLTAGSTLLPGQLLRRLFTQAGGNLCAVAVQFKAGTGTIHMRKTQTIEPAEREAAESVTPAEEGPSEPAAPAAVEDHEPGPIGVPAEAIEKPQETAVTTPTIPPDTAVPAADGIYLGRELPVDQATLTQPVAVPVQPQKTPRPAEPVFEPEVPTAKPEPEKDRPSGFLHRKEREHPAPPTPRVKAPPRPRGPGLRKRLATLWFGSSGVRQKFTRGSQTIAGQMLPVPPGQPTGLTTASMLFIAIAVPLVIAAVATTIYFRSGRGEQHQVYLQKAEAAAQAAEGQTDPALQRMGWEQAVQYIDKADEYGKSDESIALRVRAQEILDVADGIVRLSYQPATEAFFAPNVNISRIEATDLDVYILDSNEGRILRLLLTSTGYEIDREFTCGPGPSGALMIGPLVDLAVLPPNNPNRASVLGLDGNGNLLYCIPGKTPLSSQLVQPPNGWGKISALTYFQDTLYVLDSANNAVWFYEGGDGSFGDQPRLFFDNQVPVLNDTVDLAVNAEDLFILRSNNQLLQCTFRTFSFGQTRCSDPAPIGDGRPGREGQTPSFPKSTFIRMVTTQPPDPSLYVLDAANQQIVHFSLRLNLQRFLKPMPNADFPLPDKPATAFTFTPTRGVLLAVENELFYAPLP